MRVTRSNEVEGEHYESATGSSRGVLALPLTKTSKKVRVRVKVR